MRSPAVALMIAASALICGAAPASASLIAYWDFNDTNLVVDRGSGRVMLEGRQPEFGAGSTLNALAGVPAGHAFAISGDGPFTIDLGLDTEGFEDVMISFSLRADASWQSNVLKPGGVQVTYGFYSVTGTGTLEWIVQFTPSADYSMLCVGQRVTRDDFGSRPEDLPCVSGGAIGAGGATLASFDNSAFVFRVTQFPQGLTAGDQFLIDNVTVWGVPEPSILVLLGLAGAILACGRLYDIWSMECVAARADVTSLSRDAAFSIPSAASQGRPGDQSSVPEQE
jgi:hypothetical protein